MFDRRLANPGPIATRAARAALAVLVLAGFGALATLADAGAPTMGTHQGVGHSCACGMGCATSCCCAPSSASPSKTSTATRTDRGRAASVSTMAPEADSTASPCLRRIPCGRDGGGPPLTESTRRHPAAPSTALILGIEGGRSPLHLRAIHLTPALPEPPPGEPPEGKPAGPIS